MNSENNKYRCALLAGAVAGLSVDLLLFPVDTIKTRLQSNAGFWRSGGFRHIYCGLGSTAVGSMPGAAIFFCTYEGVKSLLRPCAKNSQDSHRLVFIHMTAASCGEVFACLVRVPTEVVKQRAQARNTRSISVLVETLREERIRGLYRGYFSTVMREVPFAFIQFPLWEYLKFCWAEQQCESLKAWQSGVCGAVAGAMAAGLTTPLDVAKTRIMLANKHSSLAGGSILAALKTVHMERGISGLFAGIAPRVTWISIGGFVFLGVYDKMSTILVS